MSIHLRLDGGNAVFTNLDLITGKVVLSISREESLTGIVVKLECESRTRLATPRVEKRREAYNSELEVHKLLYRTQTVFPSAQLLNAAPRGSAMYTLPPGQHEYPFKFKIPFNNACAPISSMIDRMDRVQDYNRHLKRPLPPSLSGFPGEAEIRYFVKATAQRSAFYKENFRTEVGFNFLPLEPLRSPPSRREFYARRQHQFAPPPPAGPKSNPSRKPSVDVKVPPPTISVDVRLPDPAILTSNEPIPLRVLVKKLNETPATVFMTQFQIMLIGHTKVRAHELVRVEKSSWVIVSLANIQIPLGNSEMPPQTDVEVASNLWDRVRLLNTIPPTFETCNLSRTYELEVRLGLVHGTVGDIKPELTVQPLLVPVQVYSGIKPPEALCEEMAKRQNSLRPQPTSKPTSTGPSPSPVASTSANPPPPVSDSAGAPDEPPPSYEDIMAEDLGPVDGPRREYPQQNIQTVSDNEKKKDSLTQGERLFP